MLIKTTLTLLDKFDSFGLKNTTNKQNWHEESYTEITFSGDEPKNS